MSGILRRLWACRAAPVCYNTRVRTGPVQFTFTLCLLLAQGRGLLAAESAAGPPRYTLAAQAHWQLNLPGGERFDASGLLRLPDGELLTVNDRHAGLYRIRFLPATNTADLVRVPDCFTDAQLAPFAAQLPYHYLWDAVVLVKHFRTQ